MYSLSSFRNIPYTVQSDKNDPIAYQTDLSDILSYDLSSTSLIDNTRNLNSTFNDYLIARNNINESDKSLLDIQILMAYESNMKFAKDMLGKRSDRHKMLDNLKKSIDNNKKYNYVLENIIDSSGTANDEVTFVESNTEYIEDELKSKKRNLEINQYYEKKYKKQNKVMKNIVIICIFVLFVSILFKSKIMGESIFIFCIAVLMVIATFYIMYEIFDIFMRDNFNFDEYKYFHKPSLGISEDEKRIGIDRGEIRNNRPGFCKFYNNYNADH